MTVDRVCCKTSRSQTFMGTDVRATGLRSLLHVTIGLLTTGTTIEFVQIDGIAWVLTYTKIEYV